MKVNLMKYDILKKAPGALRISAIYTVTELPLENAAFRITSPSGSVSDYTTDSTGTVVINDAESGNWSVENTSIPDCYQNADEYRVQNTGNETLATLPYDKKTSPRNSRSGFRIPKTS